MAKTTIAQLEQRVDGNGELIGAIIDKLNTMMDRQLEDHAELEKIIKLLANGLGERIAKIVATELAGPQIQWLKDLLQQQQEANREYGRQKDEERKQTLDRYQKAQERKIKLWSVVIPAVISAAGIVTVALIARGGA